MDNFIQTILHAEEKHPIIEHLMLTTTLIVYFVYLFYTIQSNRSNGFSFMTLVGTCVGSVILVGMELRNRKRLIVITQCLLLSVIAGYIFYHKFVNHRK